MFTLSSSSSSRVSRKQTNLVSPGKQYLGIKSTKSFNPATFYTAASVS